MRGRHAVCMVYIEIMNPIEAALLVAAFVLPVHLLIQWQAARMTDPRYLREAGVVIRRLEVLDAVSEDNAGLWRGKYIPASVVFMGMTYHFERIVEPWHRAMIGRCELYLEPGLLYLTEG